jgi:LuxR family maltose regulon positive regulatory protein
MALPILQTKLFLPRPRAHLVPRTALLTRLSPADLPPLTLVSAPAGFGKTTLVCEWINKIRITNYELRDAQSPIGIDLGENVPDEPTFVNRKSKIVNPSVAWLSLDEDDNDPARFLSYVIAALQTVQAAIGVSAQSLLSAPQPPPPKTILTLLLNELGTLTTPLILVLDDYHVLLTPAIHEALAFFVDHLPPLFHLIITSRIDPPLPLARWRVRNQLTEIRAADLRFRPEEAATFLNERMGLRLTTTEIAALEARTEGWIAGLQLAALSMQGRENVAGFIQAFSGSNRHVLSYLVEEVLDRRPEGTLEFLLQTAPLERFSASLCQAVTGRRDSQALLEKLEQANLFLIALDDEQNWYRYHHLFRDLLRQRLRTQADVNAINELHQRAAHWYRAQGLPDEAIRHYLAGAAGDEAADLIEQVGFERIGEGHLFRLRGWLELLPPALVRAHPRLALWRAWTLNLTGQPDALAQWLREAELSLQSAPTPLAQEMQAQITTLHAYQLRRQGEFALAIAQWQQVLNHCAPEHFLTRSTANLNLGFTYWLTGQLALAEQSLQVTQTDAKTIHAIHLVLMAKSVQANVAVAQGQLRRATQLCEETIAEGLAHTGGQPFPSAGYAYAVLGNVWYEQSAWVKAEAALIQALDLGELVTDGTIIRRAIFRLAPLKQMAGDEAASQALWQRAFAADDTVEAPYVMLQQVRAWLVQASLTADEEALAKAAQWAAAYKQPPTDLHNYIATYAQMLLGWIDLLQGRPAQTRTRLAPLLESAAAAGQTQHQLELLALQTLAYAALGDNTTAYAQLHQLLTLAAPAGYICLFIDRGEPMRQLIHALRLTMDNGGLVRYVDQVLAAFGGSGAPSASVPATMMQQDRPYPQEIQNQKPFDAAQDKSKIQNLVEPLTEREREILHLVADGLSNSEIADRLIVTVGTVKKHLNNLYGKLGVGTRTQAMARGRAMKLIE